MHKLLVFIYFQKYFPVSFKNNSTRVLIIYRLKYNR